MTQDYHSPVARMKYLKCFLLLRGIRGRQGVKWLTAQLQDGRSIQRFMAYRIEGFWLQVSRGRRIAFRA